MDKEDQIEINQSLKGLAWTEDDIPTLTDLAEHTTQRHKYQRHCQCDACKAHRVIIGERSEPGHEHFNSAKKTITFTNAWDDWQD